ncbi:MAG: CAP domain-containing protein [Chitinophagaceae bacterium]|nr:CAP domain-containing protein [Chitinophagaceae bacterium]
MKPVYLFLLFAVAASLIASCKKDDVTDHSNVQRPDFAYNVKAATLLDLVNEARTKGCKCGETNMPAVPALTWNDQLGQAAFGHSEDMKQKGYFSHDAPDGSTFVDRIKAVGYIPVAAAENIASGQTTEQQVMNSWLKSEGHCRNIMNARLKEMGAGRSGNYWTQVFGAK